jgi:hypothetical protein
VSVALAVSAAKVALPKILSVFSSTGPLHADDKAKIDRMYAARDWHALYNAMYDVKTDGNPCWFTKARSYASEKFAALQGLGVVIDQSQLYARVVTPYNRSYPEDSGATVVSRSPGPAYQAALPASPVSTADSIIAAVQAAAARGDAAATAELATRLSLGAGQAAVDATVREQQASILGLMGGGTTGIVVAAIVLVGLVLALTSHKSEAR